MENNMEVINDNKVELTNLQRVKKWGKTKTLRN
jgi:hypothetical protein